MGTKPLRRETTIAEGAVTTPGERPLAGRQMVSAMSPDAGPDALLARIRELVTDDFVGARRLAIEAAARFPQHDGLRNARRVLVEGKATVVPGHRDVNRDEEFRWLSDPPEWARGKWVALAGAAVVASADTLDEVVKAVQARQLSTPPLVHRID